MDGAWWPRSRDLLLEVPALAAALDGLWGRVTRITVNPEQWPVIPRRIPVTGHIVHAGWFTTEQDEHTIAVFSYAPRRLTLLVVPPETDATGAARLMAAAADPASTGPASALLAAQTSGSAAGPTSRSDFLPSAVTPPTRPVRPDDGRMSPATGQPPGRYPRSREDGPRPAPAAGRGRHSRDHSASAWGGPAALSPSQRRILTARGPGAGCASARTNTSRR
ncbi:DUF5994 family protein [Kitasatospora xanthocidica]|uniref:DUF5994 family protein n=1 Tax=Kitasatospora xanthocidica TaxID=83382 RepID=UPI0036E59556